MFTNFATVLSVFSALAALAPSANAAPSTGLAGRSIHRNVPAQFQAQKREYAQDSDLLEPYADYNERYSLFGCVNLHNTTFWDSCCHPLLKSETEDDLPDLCFQDIPCDPSTSSALPSTTAVASTTQHTLVVETTSSKAPVTTSKAEETTSKPADPTTTHKPATTTHTSEVKPTTSVSTGSGGFKTGGFATYFYQEGNAGACGKKHSDDDLIVAIDIAIYGYDTSVASSVCGKYVEIVNPANGHSVTAMIADVCPYCDTKTSIDLSVATFKALEADLSVGEFPIKWRYVNN